MSPLDPRQRFKMEQSQSKLSDALKRDTCTDYYEGYFSVTLHVKEKIEMASASGINLPDRPFMPVLAACCYN